MTCSNNFYHAVRWRQWRYDICWISLLELCICKIKLWYLYKQHRYIVEFSFFLTIFKSEKEPVIKKKQTLQVFFESETKPICRPVLMFFRPDLSWQLAVIVSIKTSQVFVKSTNYCIFEFI